MEKAEREKGEYKELTERQEARVSTYSVPVPVVMMVRSLKDPDSMVYWILICIRNTDLERGS